MSDEYTKQSSEFYEAVGRTLCAWQAVEIHLAIIYEKLVGARNTFAVLESFASVVSLSNRLQMLEAAAAENLDVEMAKRLKTLLARVKKASQKRNKIAHFMCNAVVDDDGLIDIFLGHWMREDEGKRSDVVRISDLKRWLVEWGVLHNAVFAFACELKK
jgi:hypothetical protein